MIRFVPNHLPILIMAQRYAHRCKYAKNKNKFGISILQFLNYLLTDSNFLVGLRTASGWDNSSSSLLVIHHFVFYPRAFRSKISKHRSAVSHSSRFFENCSQISKHNGSRNIFITSSLCVTNIFVYLKWCQ